MSDENLKDILYFKERINNILEDSNLSPESMIELLKLNENIHKLINKKIVKKAEKMNFIWEDVNNKPKADEWRPDFISSIHDVNCKMQLLVVLEAWHDMRFAKVFIPYKYFTDPNWEEEYRNECSKQKEEIEKSKYNDPDYVNYFE